MFFIDQKYKLNLLSIVINDVYHDANVLIETFSIVRWLIMLLFFSANAPVLYLLDGRTSATDEKCPGLP